MGYLFLSFALLAGAIKGYCGKKMGNVAANTEGAVLLSLLRMLLCVAISFVLLLPSGQIAYAVPSAKLIWLSMLSGFSTAFFVVSWLISVRRSAYMMVDVFLLLGTMLPMILGYFLFQEPISLRQWIGFAVLVFAVVLMCSYNNSIKTRLTLPSLLLLILCGGANGLTSLSQKLFVYGCPDVPVAVFNFYTYVFAGLALAVFFGLYYLCERPALERAERGHPFVYVFIMAAMLSAHSLFLTLSASLLDSARLYPLSQGGGLILATLMASVFFGEKLKIKAIVGISLTFAALMLMNL